MRRLTVPLATAVALIATATLSASAQGWKDDDVDGVETCRAIWREHGRSMSGSPRAVYCEVRDVGVMPRVATLQVDGSRWNGIHVRGQRRADTHVRLVIQAQGSSVDDARARAREVRLDLTSRPLQIRGIDQDERNSRRFVAATILLDVPEQTNLELSVSYAPLDVENVTGRMQLHADHGPIQIRDVGGDVRARVDYGPITVNLSGARWQGAGLDAEAEYGPVTLRLPKDFSADLTIGTDHGPLDSDFPLTLSRLDGSLIETKLGAGGPRVRAIARYGPMSLKMNR